MIRTTVLLGVGMILVAMTIADASTASELRWGRLELRAEAGCEPVTEATSRP